MFGLVKILIYLTVAVLVSGYGFLSLVRRDRLTPLDRKLPAMMLVILLALYLVPGFWYLYALLFILPVALSRTRIDACVVFIVALLGVSAVSQYVVVGSFYLTSIDTGYVLALGLLLAVAVRPATGRPITGVRFELPLLLLLTLVIVSQLRDQSATSLLRILQFSLITVLMPYYIISRSIRSAVDMERLVMAMVLGAFVLSAISVYEALRSWPIYLSMDARLGAANELTQALRLRAGLMRTAASFAESTTFSIFLAMGLVAAMASRRAFGSTGRYLAVLAVIIVGLALAQARGGWLAAILSVLAFDLYLRNYGRLAARMTILAIGAMLLLFAAAGSPRLSETLGMSGDAVGTKDYRVDLLHRGIEEIRKHPLAGRSIADVTASMQDMVQGEHIIDFVNGYVMYGVTTGIPGMVALFIVFASLAVWMLAKRRRSAGGEPPDRIGAFVFAVMASFIVSAATSGFLGRPVTFLLVVMAIGSVHHLIRQRAAGPAWSSRPASEETVTTGVPQPA